MHASTWVYFGSYSLSLLGNGIASVLFPLLVLARTGDVLAAGTVAAVTTGVGAVVGVFAGVVVDRVNRRTVSVVSDLLSAGSVAALPVVDALWGLNLAWFVGLGVVGAFGDMPGLTARESMLPRLVELSAGKDGPRPGALDRLVGGREALTAALVMAGPGIGGAIVWLSGVSATAMLITAATSTAAALLSLFLSRCAGAILPAVVSRAGVPARSGPGRALRELFEGWRFLVGNRLVWWSTLLTTVSVIALTALQVAILPAYFTAEELPGLAGLAMSGIALGSLVGAGLYAVTVGSVSRRTWFVVGVCGSVIGFLALGSLASPWIVIGAATFVGVTNGPLSAALGVALIEAIPDELRGKVLGAQNALMLAGPALALTPIAALASGYGLATAALTVAVGIAVVMVGALFVPTLRSLGGPTPHSVEHTGPSAIMKQPPLPPEA